MESTIGGTRRHIRDVARRQAQRGLDVHLVVSAERQPAFRDDLRALEQLGVGVDVLPMLREIRPGRDLRHLLALERRLRELAPDVVHTHSSKAGVLGRLASIATGVGARVHTPHTFAFLFAAMFGRLKRRLFFELERALSAASARVVAVSESEARTFRASGVVAPSKVVVVPNGIDPAPYDGVAPFDVTALGLRADRPLAGVVGLLNVAKGQDLLLRAMARPGCEALQLLVVGHGETEPALRALAAELGLEQRVRFLGFRDDVPALLAALDLLVLPSRWEGMPYVVLEAMASRRPVLATPVDGALDLVVDGETGWLAAGGDERALGERLAQALAAGEATRRAMGAAGRARLEERFSDERMVDGLLALYEGLP